MSKVTPELLEEAFAMDAAITEDRSQEAQAARVDAVAALVADENDAAPSEDEVEALYVASPAADIAPEPDGVPLEVLVARVQYAAGELSDARLQQITDGAFTRAEIALRQAEAQQAAEKTNPAVAGSAGATSPDADVSR